MDGEYDIFGNPIIPPLTKATEVASPTPKAVPSFNIGDNVEVKEGGKKFRKATVLKVDSSLGALDLAYSDDSRECGVPFSLCRKVHTADEAISDDGPPGIGRPTIPVKSEAEVSGRRKRDGPGSKARACYELVKTFSEPEQEAAYAILLSLDGVRASKGGASNG